MGKRNKTSSKAPKKDDVDLLLNKTDLGLSKPKRKRAVDEVLEEAADNSVKSKQKKAKKNKIISESEHEPVTVTEENNSAPPAKEGKHKTNKTIKNTTEQTPLPTKVRKNKNKSGTKSEGKKIVFADDEPQEASVQKSGNKKGKKKKIQELNEGEEEVDDGEIDKFCDDLSEQDNEQYEQWVQLLEAKLRPNKKS